MKKIALIAMMVIAGISTGSTAWAQAGAPHSHGRRVDLKAERESLLAADRALAEAAHARGMADGYASGFADDAVFLPVRSDVVRGRDAIQAYFRGAPFFTSLTWEPVRADVSADGTVGYTLGFGRAVTAEGDTVHARLISFWRKDADGAWKLAAHVPALNPEAPRPVPAGFGTPNDNGLAGVDHNADAAASLAAVLQADRDFAALAAARDVQVAFTTFAAPTGLVMGGPEYGPDQISASFAEAVRVGATLEWGPILGGVADSGDLGYTVGIAVSTGPNGKRYTKYLSIWQRQPDGTFKYVADGGTSRPAPAQ